MYKTHNYSIFVFLLSTILTDIPIFLASVESVILAKGLSAPQHSTYLVILLEGRDLEGTPGVAIIYRRMTKYSLQDA